MIIHFGRRMWTKPTFKKTRSYNDPSISFSLNNLDVTQILWKRIKPLHGIYDSGDYWYRTFRKHLINDLSLISTPTDKSL